MVEIALSLRRLDDTDCSNIVMSRRLRRLAKKFPSLSELSIDCWTHGGHYTTFKMKNNMPTWICNIKEVHYPSEVTVQLDSESLDKEELNKLLVFTYRTMCDNQDSIDLLETPEDILNFAEQKLKRLLSDEEQSDNN